MTTVVLVPFEESRPLESHTITWDQDGSYRDSIKSLLADTDYLETPLLRPRGAVAGLFAHYNIPEDESGRENVRATRLAMACGLFSLRFRGNVLLIRSFSGSWIDLDIDSVFGACNVSQDLRADVQKQINEKTLNLKTPSGIPDWLAGAAQQNYHDSVAVQKLASVMKETSKEQDISSTDESEAVSDGCSDEEKPSSRRDQATDTSLPSEFVARSPLCLHCRAPASTLCLGCDAAYFCQQPRPCRQDGWSHNCLCSSWQLYAKHRQDLSTFSFLGEWHHILVRREFQQSEIPYKEFLKSFGIDGGCQSWWRTELGGWSGGQSESATTIDVTARRTYIEGFSPIEEIPPERYVSAEDLNRVGHEIKKNSLGMLVLESWEDYYRLRDIPETSIAALICTFPLTIYEAIVAYGEVPVTVARMLKRPLRMHVVGAEKEINFLDVFKEVGFLVPEDLVIELTFVVREDMLPPKCRRADGKFSKRIEMTSNLTVNIIGGTYGDSLDPKFDCGGGAPDMLVALNAGLFAYESWRSVVNFLNENTGIVGVFTDYNEYSGLNCAALGGGNSRESLRMNPFRQPRAMPVYSMNLPQFSNGFFYVFNEQELE